MKTFTYTSHNSEETMDFASELANKLNIGDVVVLSGELGSGKTKFTEGFLKHFGLENEISSPTFTIVNEYKNKDINIYHFDVYRLEDVDEFYAIGGDEYFNEIQKNDKRKNEYCLNNNIPLLRIKYKDITDAKKIITNFINNIL